MDARKRQELESQLSAYLDGELTPEERKEVEAFLAADAEARGLLHELQATIAAVGLLPRAKAGDELMHGLRARLEKRALLGEAPAVESRPVRPVLSGGRWVAAAAVIALSFTAGYLTLRYTRPETAPETRGTRFALTEGKETAPEGRAPAAAAPKAEPRMPEGGRKAGAGYGGGRVSEDGSARVWADDDANEKRPAPVLDTVPRTPPDMESSSSSQARAKELLKAEQVTEGVDLVERPAGAPEKPGEAEGVALHDRRPLDEAGDVLKGPVGKSAAAASPLGKGLAAARARTAVQNYAVMELAYADEASQQAAVESLRRRFAFRPISSRGGEGAAREPVLEPARPGPVWAPEFVLDVPDEQALNRMVVVLQQDQSGVAEVRVVPEELTVTERLTETQRAGGWMAAKAPVAAPVEEEVLRADLMPAAEACGQARDLADDLRAGVSQAGSATAALAGTTQPNQQEEVHYGFADPSGGSPPVAGTTQAGQQQEVDGKVAPETQGRPGDQLGLLMRRLASSEVNRFALPLARTQPAISDGGAETRPAHGGTAGFGGLGTFGGFHGFGRHSYNEREVAGRPEIREKPSEEGQAAAESLMDEPQASAPAALRASKQREAAAESSPVTDFGGPMTNALEEPGGRMLQKVPVTAGAGPAPPHQLGRQMQQPAPPAGLSRVPSSAPEASLQASNIVRLHLRVAAPASQPAVQTRPASQAPAQRPDPALPAWRRP